MTAKPLILIDTREQSPLIFENCQTEPATLTTGDYGLKGCEHSWVVERKELNDLIGSLTQSRDRFLRELQRMKAYPFRRLLIEGTRSDIESHRYRSRATPQSILGSLATIEIRYNLPVVFADTRRRAAELIEGWAKYYYTEQVKHARSILALTESEISHKAIEEVIL